MTPATLTSVEVFSSGRARSIGRIRIVPAMDVRISRFLANG